MPFTAKKKKIGVHSSHPRSCSPMSDALSDVLPHLTRPPSERALTFARSILSVYRLRKLEFIKACPDVKCRYRPRHHRWLEATACAQIALYEVDGYAYETDQLFLDILPLISPKDGQRRRRIRVLSECVHEVELFLRGRAPGIVPALDWPRLIPDHDIGRALSTLVRNRGEELGLESECVTRAVDLMERWIRVGRFIHYGRTTAGALLHLADGERVSVTAAAAVCRIDGRTMKRAADDILEDLRELVEDAHSGAPALKKSRIASS